MKAFIRNHKATIAVFASLFLVYLLIIGLTDQVAQERIDDHLELERERTKTQVAASINRYEVFSNYLSEVLITDEVTSLMVDANSTDTEVKNQAREALETLLMDEYQVLRKYNFRQFHFHLPTGESFLRLHAPGLYGDMLFDARESVRIVNTEHVYVSGFEEGKIYNGYRFIYPLFKDNTHLGSVEISVSYEAVLDSLYTVAPSEDAFFIMKASIVNDNVFQDYKTNYTKSSLSDAYLRDTEVFEAFRHRRYHFSGLELERFFSNVKPNIEPSIAKETSFSYALNCDDCDYLMHFISIKNFEGEHVGYLFTLHEDPHYTELINENRINLLLISLFFASLFIFLGVSAKSRAKLRTLSRNDPLTGLANRLYFIAQVEALLNNAKRNESRLSVIMIDIDDFKEVNDTYGHMEGDRVLRDMAKTFENTLRQSDIIGRWGGEEFLIALPDTNREAALKVAEKIRQAIKNNVKTKEGAPITISLGLTTHVDKNTSLDTLIQEADTALYKAKKQGKDQVSSND